MWVSLNEVTFDLVCKSKFRFSKKSNSGPGWPFQSDDHMWKDKHRDKSQLGAGYSWEKEGRQNYRGKRSGIDVRLEFRSRQFWESSAESNRMAR